jgi:hypothetical protein
MHIKDTFIQWFENNPFQLAAALANYTLFSMASTFVDCALNCRLSVRARSFRYMKTARARTNLLAVASYPRYLCSLASCWLCPEAAPVLWLFFPHLRPIRAIRCAEG